MRIVDADGDASAAGEAGEICVRVAGRDAAATGARPRPTAEALRDGWLHTGDVGYLDEDGYLYIVDRMKDLIIRGGFNVYPRDVEDALLEHPAVAVAAVVGRPDRGLRRGGRRVRARCAPAATVTAEELVAWARERIGGYKYPREVQIVDAIPLTPSARSTARRCG